ncbi:hypothetical protein R8Z57_07980 [Microbacterium sp. M3]|uniref:Uncharacterized protein n=1 Tax=Microbacterium arthrosphaerae TaxID=792652 RepID=A0ABU4H058_9MICO|nr:MULTISPECIES: hypothetical protein [Microbacterium]MDW4572711.1 hypothetical protein [Microbacterium arthrosphaerae]MDW7606566.1 hypothetical protein [Microbacterium sp. M3]
MRALRRSIGAVGSAAVAVFVLTACATASPSATPAPAALGEVSPVPPSEEVAATGTVLDVAGDAQLCLGAVAESYPPQCIGIPLDGWTWDGVESYESSGDVTWGAYAVRGTYDGERFALTQPPIMLALYDPIRPEDPTGGRPGKGDDETLARLQEELPDRLGSSYLSSWPQDGWLWVDVVWDDGSWQRAADAEFGEDIVVIRSAMTPTGG